MTCDMTIESGKTMKLWILTKVERVFVSWVTSAREKKCKPLTSSEMNERLSKL